MNLKWSFVFLSFYLVAAKAAILQPNPSTSTTQPPDKTTSTTTTTTSTTSTSTTSTSTQSTSTTSTSTTSTPPPQQTTTDNSQPTPSLTTLTRGSDVIVTFTSSAAPSSSSTAPPSPPPSSDSGLGTGSIVGLSVAGGVALIGVVAFFIWKFTRKSFSDFDDNEAIKWPDLNNHASGNLDSHPLPVKNTGRSGFDTASEADLSLPNNYSTPDFNQSDPYAVPPLPHLNPNQPYTDDPNAMSPYYDPYRGSVPGTIEHPTAPPEWGQDAIPMTQMGPVPAPATPGRNSPAPQLYDQGRRSPGPFAAYDPYGTPTAPSGRMSPGPQIAYNNTRTMSPAPGPTVP